MLGDGAYKANGISKTSYEIIWVPAYLLINLLLPTPHLIGMSQWFLILLSNQAKAAKLSWRHNKNNLKYTSYSFTIILRELHAMLGML